MNVFIPPNILPRWDIPLCKHRLSEIFVVIKQTARSINTCLGVDLDERFTWEKHIDNICAKVGAGIMRRMKPFVPVEILKLIYNALVQPYFDYCSTLWDNCGSIVLEKCFKVCRIALREL
jgi:hypothetical protein